MSPPKIDELYQQYQSAILGYLNSFTDYTTAQELCQEVFLKVQHGLANFQGHASVKTWLYKIATNTLKDYYKSKQQQNAQRNIPLSELETDTQEDESRCLEIDVIQEEMRHCIIEFIHQLPENYSIVLALAELEGYKISEIAEILDDTPEAVKVRLHRARKRLKTKLQEGCSFYYNEENQLACDRRPPKA